MRECNQEKTSPGLTRREFVQSAAFAGLMATVPGWAQEQAAASKPATELAVAIIGPGSQGRNLLNNCLKIDGVRFVAVCDIWPYHQQYAANILKKFDQPVNVYREYQELLAKEKHLDAVIVATPDWMHAEHAIACLKGGKHVYCEKEMSNSLDSAKQMVLAARETKKLLQIGHQRRSEPLYHHALRLLEKDKFCGRITHVYGQWNRAELLEWKWPEGQELDADTLKRYGYDTMDRFRNWRWYKKYSGGAMADLGSHQVDVFNWFLKGPPKAVLASGGIDYYTGKGREWYDNVLAIYEYETPEGPVRGFYQVLNTTSSGGFYETLMGFDGTLTISEDPTKALMFKEDHAPRPDWVNESDKIESMGKEQMQLVIGKTLSSEGKKEEAQKLVSEAQKPPHQLHLENFFNAIREGTPLSCPPEVAYETAVSVLKANDAVAAGKRLEFKPEEFKV